MPLYNYRCIACDNAFEALVRSSEVPTCPSCGSENLERQLSYLAPDGKSAAIIQKGRAQAAREGHFSNYSPSERSRK